MYLRSKSIVYFVLTVDLKLEIDKFRIIDVFVFILSLIGSMRFGFGFFNSDDAMRIYKCKLIGFHFTI